MHEGMANGSNDNTWNKIWHGADRSAGGSEDTEQDRDGKGFDKIVIDGTQREQFPHTCPAHAVHATVDTDN